MAKYFLCTLNKPALSFRTGEPMEFFVAAFEDGMPIACPQVQWELAGDDGQMREGIAVCRQEKGFSLQASCETPGFVRLICTALREDGNPDADFEVCVSGAGADVEKIRVHDVPPEDFDAYWKNIENVIADFSPVLLDKTPYTEGVPEEFECFDVKISSPSARPASGYLSIPKGKGPFPLIVSFRGYGLTGAQPSFSHNAVHLNVNAHGIENGFTREENEQIRYPSLARYGFDETENARPETTYWQGMMLRNLAALKFLKTLPEWDGKNLTCSGGSQGALQAVTCAAHDKDVTFLDLSVPWFCDLNAENHGCIPGWRPTYAPGLRYFDTVFQAAGVACPVHITARLGDTVCPPGTVMALYHGFGGKKTIEFIQSGTHTSLPRKLERFTLRWDPARPEETVLPGKYRHFKGKEYQVLFTAQHSETLEKMVVYQALYGAGGIWVRPAAMWEELVPLHGKLVYRFSFVSEE